MALGAARHVAGDAELAARYLGEGLLLARATGHPFALGSTLYWCGEVALAAGDWRRARERFEESLAISRAADLLWGAAYCLASLGRIALAQADLAAARRHQQEALAVRRDMDDRRGIAWSVEELAWVAGLDGQVEDAARLFGASAALHAQLGLPLVPVPEWRALHDQAETAARDRLGAQRYATAWSAGRVLTRTEAIALALASGSPERETTGLQGGSAASALSGREREVAALVAEGCTNRAIARRLVISEHTVASHVGAILTKLGMDSRTQVAAWVAQHGLSVSPS
jgi:non-specific serine/threonine protein kinase